MKAKSIKGFFEAIVAGKFSYSFHPDFWTLVKESDVSEVTRLYGSSLQFEEVPLETGDESLSDKPVDPDTTTQDDTSITPEQENIPVEPTEPAEPTELVEPVEPQL